MGPAPKEDPRRTYKYSQIKTDLSIQILEGQLRPHDRVPSLNEIVQKYRVSKITARRVLNDLVTEGLVYASRGRGSFVSDAAMRQRKDSAGAKGQPLGVVFEHAAGPFMNDIILGIDEEAFTRNAQITLCLSNNSYEREAEILQRLANQGITKIILFMVIQNDDGVMNPNIPLYLRLQDQGVRILFLVCTIPGFPIPSVTYDDYDAFRRLVRFMKEKGKRRLVCVHRFDNASTTMERERGFKDGLLENSLPYDENRIVAVKFQSYDTIVSDACEAFRTFLKKGIALDGVLCSDELVAAGVFDALEIAGDSPRSRPWVGGLGSHRNLHVLRGNPYVLLAYETYRLGKEAASIMLRNELPPPSQLMRQPFHRVIPVPLRVPKNMK